MKLSVYRLDPDADAKPDMQDYDVALEPTDHTLLEATLRITLQDDSLASGNPVAKGVCGFDAINISG